MPKQCLETKHISQYLSMMEEVYLCVLDHCDHIKLKVLQCCVISSEDLVYDGEDVEWLMDDLPVIRAFEEDLVRQVNEEVRNGVLADQLNQQEAHEDVLWDLAPDQSFRRFEDLTCLVFFISVMGMLDWHQSLFVLDLMPFAIRFEDETIAIVFELEGVHGLLKSHCVFGSQVSKIAWRWLWLCLEQRGELLCGLRVKQLVELRLFHYYYMRTIK